MIRCIACGTENIPAATTECPNPDCREYLPVLLRDMLPGGTLLHDGKYEIECALGRGGFGITYRASHRALSSLVAIKEFFPIEDAARHTATGGLTVSPAKKDRYDRWLERFCREGRILSGLDHPGVVRVRDLFRERGTAYLVMDLVKGRTLRREMDEAGRLPAARVEAITAGLVDALEVVHAAGVFHLDVSPENVLVRPDGTVVLIDFGAARQEVALRSSRAYRMEYAAPELLLRGEVGPQTDLYELAMVVHEMLTGETPERVLGQDWKPEGLETGWGDLLAEALQAERTARPESVRQWWDGWPPAGVRVPAREMIIALDGSGDFVSLEEAAVQAATGSVIRLPSGVHRLKSTLILDRSLTLLGAGPERTEVLGEANVEVLRLLGDHDWQIEGIAFRHEGEMAADVAQVSGGRPHFEKCSFTGGVWDADRKIGGDGIWFTGSGSGVVSECSCIGNGGVGIRVSGQARPTLEKNECRDNKQGGIHYTESAGGTARHNHCIENGGCGIGLSDRARPMLEKNQCVENEVCGIGVQGEAQPTLERNECVENVQHGIFVSGRAQPTLEENECRGNTQAGILYMGSAGGAASQNHCIANEMCGIGVQGEAQPTLERNECIKNVLHGICVTGQAQPTLEENECRGNTSAGILYLGSDGGTARHNHCIENEACGIGVQGEAQPTLERNECRGNQEAGIQYAESADGTARYNQCNENGWDGILVRDQAQPTLENNECRGNKKWGIFYAGHCGAMAGDNVCLENGGGTICIVNPVDGAEMVYVPSGEFQMGSNVLGAEEKPEHRAHLDGFWMYRGPVTVAQFRKFCGATGRVMPEAPSWGWKESHPVVNVSWHDAATYAEWARAQLPTEAQWEKAGRGTDGRKYPWGNDWDTENLQCSRARGGDAGGTAPVGSFPDGVSPYGCLDMAGNVSEWCADWYDANYYRHGPMHDPPGPASGKARVLRGGSWNDSGWLSFHVPRRYRTAPIFRHNYIGFRCVVLARSPVASCLEDIPGEPGDVVPSAHRQVGTEAHVGSKVAIPLIVYDEGNRAGLPWVPSGMMGNVDAIKMDPTWADNAHAGKHSLKVQYTAVDSWGGVVWQYPENDWGKLPGGYDLSGAKKLTFWARGDKGGEVVSFCFGLLDEQAAYHDSARGALDEVTLTPDWKQYSMDLAGKNLDHIKTGFCWTVTGQGAPLTFYLDDIRYE